MKRTDIKTITYDVGFQDFMVDVVEEDCGYSAYIYKSTSAIKSLMFCSPEKDLDKFLKAIDDNLINEMLIYNEEYGD